MKYELFFFKENNRIIDLDELFRFFNFCPYIKTKMESDEVLFNYYHEDLKLQATFHISKVSKVPDIYRLNPRFLDLDIYLTLDPTLPQFKVSLIMELVKDLCLKFNFFVYNVLFEDVSSFRKDLILKSYELFRNAYREKYPMEFYDLNYLSREKLNDILKYIYERKDLMQYYEHDGLYFPKPTFIKGDTSGKLYSQVEFVEDSLFVFPPQTDLICYRIGDVYKVIYCDEFLSVLEKYLTDLAGFGRNTKVLDKNGVKKVRKIISKTKFTEICDTFKNISIDTIVDYK